jgi:hypothetical protein
MREVECEKIHGTFEFFIGSLKISWAFLSSAFFTSLFLGSRGRVYGPFAKLKSLS